MIHRNRLTGALPVDLGTDSVQSFSVGANPDLGGPIPTSYAHIPGLSFAFVGSPVCASWDEATLAMLGIPLQSFEQSPLRCADEAGLNIGIHAGSVTKFGKPIEGEEALHRGDQIEARMDVDLIAEVFAECDIGKIVVFGIIHSQVIVGLRSFELENPEEGDWDIGSALIMMLLDPSTDWIAKACASVHAAQETTLESDGSVVFALREGTATLQTVHPSAALELQTPHMVVQSTGPVHYEIGVDPERGAILTMIAGSAMMRSHGGMAQRVEAAHGVAVAADGSEYSFDLQQIFLPRIIR